MSCSCHISPPCSWCCDLTQAEADIYEAEGAEAVEAYRREAFDAWLDLEDVISDWAELYKDVVRFPDILAKQAARYVFEELLDIPIRE